MRLISAWTENRSQKVGHPVARTRPVSFHRSEGGCERLGLCRNGRQGTPRSARGGGGGGGGSGGGGATAEPAHVPGRVVVWQSPGSLVGVPNLLVMAKN